MSVIYDIEFMPNEMKYKITKNGKTLQIVSTLETACRIVDYYNEADKNFKGFGQWGVPSFLKKIPKRKKVGQYV